MGINYQVKNIVIFTYYLIIYWFIESEVMEILADADIDSDGKINYDEFVRMMMAK